MPCCWVHGTGYDRAQHLFYTDLHASTMNTVRWTLQEEVMDVLQLAAVADQARPGLLRPTRAGLAPNPVQHGQAAQPAEHLQAGPLEIVTVIEVALRDMLAQFVLFRR